MKRSLALIPLLVLTVAVFCQARSPEAGKEDEAETLLQTDREFDQAAAEKGAEGWVAYFAENGSMLTGDAPPIVGHEAIRKAMEGVFTGPDSTLRWQPARAEILIPGVLGYTTGRYQRRRKSPEGKPLLQEGAYVSVWRKQPDGQWKIVLDTGQPDGPPRPVEQ